MANTEEKIFYPKFHGKTKREVIELIEERFEDDTFINPLSKRQRRKSDIVIRPPDINKLTDKRMQQYIDKCADVFWDGLEGGVENACTLEEEQLQKLAKLIQQDV